MTQINTLSPMERLNQLQGLDKIREQFEKYRKSYKFYVEGKAPGRFHPHMVFMGNPGTGRTTVARLFGAILHDDGLLPQGQFVEAKVGDLVGHYIGETRVKAAALCDQAKGGVLFIDEAYGLMSGAGVHGADYGQEAIEVLIQFMMNNDDTVVILAGYTDEMKRFINECNPGFRSHCFNESLGFFYFEDYTDEQLWEILKLKFNAAHLLMDERACEDMALNYFASLPRDSYFGNARVLETLIPVLRNNLDKRYVQATDEQRKDPDFAMRILPEDFPATEVYIDSDLTPMERLNRMQGIDNIQEQFQRYREEFKLYREGKRVTKFRPHMVFMGNPGTGKTTIARLFAEILHEDGLLPQGQFIEATPDDLVGHYIGETRVKAAALCDRAKGGVLFIDEAYGLMSGAGGHGANYGQEAIEVLIQFMENNDDSLVILAGYPEETKRLIAEGNPGFKSRFNQSLGFFYFEDYEPDSLFNILVDKLNGYEITEECKSEMRQIIRYQYEHRDEKRWGNARTMENYADEILRVYFFKHHGDGIIDVDCIPEQIRIPEVNKKQLKEELMLMVNELQEKLQQLQSKLNELSEE